MRLTRTVGILLVALVCASASPACAVQIVIDYRYDTQDFFDPTTGDGQLARATVEAAATFFSTTIIPTDTLNAIQPISQNPPPPNYAPVWRQIFRHPGTGEQNYTVSSAANASVDGLTVLDSDAYPPADEFRNIQIAANQILVYVGGSNLSGSALGESSTGFGAYGSQSFLNSVSQRGKPVSEYATWGGSIAFDKDAARNWNFDYTMQPAAGEADLYSVALHEMGHILGLCGSNEQFDDLVDGNEFQGEQALAAWINDDPSASAGGTGIPLVGLPAGVVEFDYHWKDNSPNPNSPPSVESFILGTTKLQEAAMDPTLSSGKRKLFTRVDTFALRDIGWTVPNSVFEIPADYNDDGDVDGDDATYWNTWYGINANGDANGDGSTDGLDFLVWQRNYTGPLPLSATTAVPEPTSLALLMTVALGYCCKRGERDLALRRGRFLVGRGSRTPPAA